MIRHEAWPFYRTSSGVRLCWSSKNLKDLKEIYAVREHKHFLCTPQLYCAPGRNHRTARLRLSPPTDRSCGRRRRRPTPVQSGGCRAPPPVSRKGWALARDLAALHLDGDEPGPRLRGAGLLRRTRRHQPARLHDRCSQERCSRPPRLKRMCRKNPVRGSSPRPCAKTARPSDQRGQTAVRQGRGRGLGSRKRRARGVRGNHPRQ